MLVIIWEETLAFSNSSKLPKSTQTCWALHLSTEQQHPEITMLNKIISCPRLPSQVRVLAIVYSIRRFPPSQMSLKVSKVSKAINNIKAKDCHTRRMAPQHRFLKTLLLTWLLGTIWCAIRRWPRCNKISHNRAMVTIIGQIKHSSRIGLHINLSKLEYQSLTFRC